jgi:hypothetical protein
MRKISLVTDIIHGVSYVCVGGWMGVLEGGGIIYSSAGVSLLDPLITFLHLHI